MKERFSRAAVYQLLSDMAGHSHAEFVKITGRTPDTNGTVEAEGRGERANLEWGAYIALQDAINALFGDLSDSEYRKLQPRKGGQP